VCQVVTATTLCVNVLSTLDVYLPCVVRVQAKSWQLVGFSPFAHNGGRPAPGVATMDTQETLVRWLRSCDVDEEAVDLSLAMGLTKVSVSVS
jgi:hypothetical protein